MELTVDGRRVYAATGGQSFDPELPAVIFLHGAAMDHTVFSLQTRWFAYHGRSVLALDLPGCGRSEGPMPDSLADFADWVARLLDAAGLRQAALIGHSLGGLVALETAARHPDRVRALALLGVAMPMSVNGTFLALAEENDHKAIELMNDWAHGRRAHIGGNRAPGLWLIGGGTRLVERAAPGVLYRCLKLCDDYPAEAGFAAAAKVTCPVLTVLGEQDQMTRVKPARDFATRFADSTVVVLPGCGHLMMSEQPDQTLDALRQIA